jgi:hypothetical protein
MTRFAITVSFCRFRREIEARNFRNFFESFQIFIRLSDWGESPAETQTNVMKRKIALLTTLLTLTGAAIYTNTTAFAQNTTPPPSAEDLERHPEIRDALASLEKAEASLKLARHDFDGHRKAALKSCDAAIEELKLALQYAHDHEKK